MLNAILSRFLLSLVLFGVLGISPNAALATNESRLAPNVVLLITDDQGYGDFGIHGNTLIRTPHFDALARDSFRFTNFHVDPTCAETRSALMTGRYSCRTGVWHTVMGRSILRRDETTMADVFLRSGYRTGIFGKWHLGDNYPYRPQDRGFQEVLIHGGGGVGQTPDFWGNDYFDDTYWHNGVPEKQQGYCTDVWFQAALKFIEQNRDQPFFCYIATNAPHGPYNIAEKYSQPYIDQGVSQPMANFYGMITNVDENVGRLVEHLEKLGLSQRTIVIAMTDNGTAAGVTNQESKPRAPDAQGKTSKWQGFSAGMRAMKGSQYEGGHRVPCFLHIPPALRDTRALRGRTPSPPGEIGALVAHFDLLPTLIQLCELAPPSVEFDGRSLMPLLAGDESEFDERTLIVHSQRVDRPEKWRKSAVMAGRWRLVDGKELYDVTADAAQKNDVAAANGEVVNSLRTAYESWWASVSRRFHEYSEIPLGEPDANPTTLTCHDWHGPEPLSSQDQVRRNPESNGFWAVRIATDGEYEFTLRARPEGVAHSLRDGTAGLVLAPSLIGAANVGGVSLEQPIQAGQDAVTFRAYLQRGSAGLMTILEEGGAESRGAFYVTVKKLAPAERTLRAAGDEGVVPLEDGDRVVLLGGTFIERMQAYGYFESRLLAAYPDRRITVRNLGWSGDNVWGHSRAVFGKPDEGFARLEKDLREARPTVIVLAYGENEAHAGEAAVPEFVQGLNRLLDVCQRTQAKIVLLAPRRHEQTDPRLPNPETYNQNLRSYSDAIKQVGGSRKLPVFDLYYAVEENITDNGIHMSDLGYWRLAPILARHLGVPDLPWNIDLDLGRRGQDATNVQLTEVAQADGGLRFLAKPRREPLPLPPNPPGPERDPDAGRLRIRGLRPGSYSVVVDGVVRGKTTAERLAREDGELLSLARLADSDPLFQAVSRKNELYFHRYRPQNETYLFLFRKHEQGNNAVEVPQFEPLVGEMEAKIRDLVTPRPRRVEIRPR